MAPAMSLQAGIQVEYSEQNCNCNIKLSQQ